MEISKAIEILRSREELLFGEALKKDREAIQLGIEALKRIENCRIKDAAFVELALPGETERR